MSEVPRLNPHFKRDRIGSLRREEEEEGSIVDWVDAFLMDGERRSGKPNGERIKKGRNIFFFFVSEERH